MNISQTKHFIYNLAFQTAHTHYGAHPCAPACQSLPESGWVRAHLCQMVPAPMCVVDMQLYVYFLICSVSSQMWEMSTNNFQQTFWIQFLPIYTNSSFFCFVDSMEFNSISIGKEFEGGVRAIQLDVPSVDLIAHRSSSYEPHVPMTMVHCRLTLMTNILQYAAIL